MDLERMFAYDDWANRQELPALRELAAPEHAAHRLFAHIVGTQWLWLTRVRGQAAKLAVWPELTVDQCEAELALLSVAWDEVLRDADRTAVIEYRNSKGEQWKSRVDDVLAHVVLHGVYHRGQMATLLRQDGAAPPYTDFIHATRAGLLED